MENAGLNTKITLEESTPAEQNIQSHINHYYHDPEKIERRLAALEAEEDLDTWLQAEGSALVISGTILGLISNRKWLVLPLAVSLVMIANVFRRNQKSLSFLHYTGLRRREEIEKEKYALKILRGDFQYLLDVPNAVWDAINK